MPDPSELAANEPPTRRIAVLVSGSGTNLQALLDTVGEDDNFGGEVVVVGSDQPDCLGLERARRAGIADVGVALRDHPDRPTWERRLIEELEAHAPDLVVLAGFMRLVSADFLSRWPQRVVNVHPSLLPAFPGAHGVRDALEYGVKVSGATIHIVDEEVDHGPIIAQEAVPVEPRDDVDRLHERIKQVEYRLLPACVKLLCHDRVRIDGRHAIVTPATRAEALTAIDVEDEEHPHE